MSVDIDKILKKAKELNAKKKNKPQCNSVITGLPAEYKPWYQGDNFSPEEAEKLETTSQPLIMEVLVTAAVEDNLEVTNLKTIFKEDNFMDNDVKKDETQVKINRTQIVHNSGTDRTQIVHNSGTDRTQIVHNSGTDRTQLVHDSYTDRTQTVLKQYSNSTQTVLKRYPNSTQTVLKDDSNSTQTVLKDDSNSTQTVLKQYSNSTQQTVLKQYSNLDLSTVTGSQQELLFYIYNLCKTGGSKITPPLSIKNFCENTEVKKGTIKAALNRLIEKGFLTKEKSRTGRCGWISYKIPDQAYKELLNNGVPSPSTINGTQTVLKQYSNGTQIPVSSSSIINITTTTNGNGFPEEWKNVNLDLLQYIGFSENHLRQLFNFNTPELVEESIKHFAFGLLNNPKTKQYPNPINVLMGVLRKGQAWVENNYKSLQEIAQEELVARKKAEAERLVKLEQEIYNAEFKIWESGLSATELKAIEFGTQYLGPLKARLKACFDKTIWPTKQNKP